MSDHLLGHPNVINPVEDESKLSADELTRVVRNSDGVFVCSDAVFYYVTVFDGYFVTVFIMGVYRNVYRCRYGYGYVVCRYIHKCINTYRYRYSIDI